VFQGFTPPASISKLHVHHLLFQGFTPSANYMSIIFHPHFVHLNLPSTTSAVPEKHRAVAMARSLQR
jgi:hypothetical protein